jgi:hypothetical protein
VHHYALSAHLDFLPLILHASHPDS